MKVKNTQQDPKEKQIRREEFIKQSKEIEKVLLPHGETLQESPEELEEAYKRMISYLKESGVYEEDGPAHRSTNTATGSSRSRKAMRFLAKCAVIAILCGGSLFALSMRSEANRVYFMDTVNYLIGNDTQIDIGMEKGDDMKDLTEDEVKERIEEKIGVKVPKFNYRPKDMKYCSYKIDTLTGTANLNYELEGKTAVLLISNNDGAIKGNVRPHGKEIVKYDVNTAFDGMEIEIIGNKEETDAHATYTASWKYENTYYQFSCKLEEEEFVKIAEQIYF